MRLIHGLEAVDALALAVPESGETPRVDAASAACVGVFDGVHLGHQRLLHELLEMASHLGGLPTVITFENHPDQLLHGTTPPPLISVPHRLRLLRRAGVQRVVLLTFEPQLMDLTAAEFTERVLVRALHTRGLLLGFDSAMGKDREGTPARFATLGKQHGFEVQEGQPFVVDGEPVSSTAIRNAIQGGDLNRAERLLGRWPSCLGKVLTGAGRGRTLGFPTANVQPEGQLMPPDGVYAVEVLLDGNTLHGVANLGSRPTFTADDTAPHGAPAAPRWLEVHVLDFSRDLYGQDLEVGFVAKLRDEQRFADADALTAQITADLAAARKILSA